MNWMTVKELAKYLKLSEVMIYKLAQAGTIPAAKIGSAWRFAQDEIDAWLKQQSRTAVSIAEPAKSAVEDFVYALQEHYGKKLSAVMVFGSYARGEADQSSDVDVLVVLKKIDDFWREKSSLDELAYSNSFDKGRHIVLATVLIDEEEFLTGSSPLVINVRREGIRAA